MNLSQFEAESILQKAIISTGRPFGLAREIAKAGSWLVGQGEDGIGSVLKALDAEYQLSDMRVERDDLIVFDNAKIANCGPSIFELLKSGTCKIVHLTHVKDLMLLVGMAGQFASNSRIKFKLACGNTLIAGVDCNGLELTQGFENTADIVELTLIEYAAQHEIKSPTISDFKVDELSWQRVCEMAARTYVRSSEDSRTAGAGAGLTDND